MDGQIEKPGFVRQEDVDYEMFTSTEPGALFT